MINGYQQTYHLPNIKNKLKSTGLCKFLQLTQNKININIIQIHLQKHIFRYTCIHK